MSETETGPGAEAPDVHTLIRENIGELAGSMGLQLTTLTPESVQATMPVAGNRQPFGLLHGGASAVMAETLGSLHAMLLATPGRLPVGIELSCTHHRSAKDGSVHATSTPVNVGRTLATFSISIRDDDDRLICTSRLTCMYRDGV
jgi:1,4-dihydroxy-2-naphthoyl-CoA hydrolase